jgi:hypothetical protein
MKLEFSRQFFEKSKNIIFHENPSSGSRVVPCRQTDMTKLIVVFRNFANAPKTTNGIVNTDRNLVRVGRICINYVSHVECSKLRERTGSNDVSALSKLALPADPPRTDTTTYYKFPISISSAVDLASVSLTHLPHCAPMVNISTQSNPHSTAQHSTARRSENVIISRREM